MNIKGLKFERTCYACPEQYDVFDSEDEIVGYVRLRWGALSCQYPDFGGETIYETNIGDDTGVFGSEEERMYHLNNIADKILEKMNSKFKELTLGEFLVICPDNECETCPIKNACIVYDKK